VNTAAGCGIMRGMTVIFVGGPLDGELREVGEVIGYWAGPAEGENFYSVANGIARHESVSDDEVARRVHDYQTAAMHWMRGESNDKLTMQLHHPLAWHS
jgi:hypothetical protein